MTGRSNTDRNLLEGETITELGVNLVRNKVKGTKLREAKIRIVRTTAIWMDMVVALDRRKMS